METTIGAAGLPAVLDLPAGPVRGGLVVLHGSHAEQRSYFLYEHLARLLPPAGIAVLRYDRRPRIDGHDVPLADQADDASAALTELRRHVGTAPVGLWGFSQGAWAAALTATRHPVDFLVLVGCSAVSPAVQMRHGTAEQLRRNGYGPADLAELAELRRVAEGYQRGEVPRPVAQAAIDAAARRPWFPLAFLPEQLPATPGTWTDMDYDPAPVLARLTCPVLLCYGETDAWIPIEDSLAVWRRAARDAELTVARLAGCDHAPTLGEGEGLDSVSPQYERVLLDWLGRTLPRMDADLPTFEFAFPGPLRDQLVAAVLDGSKTTTTGLVQDYEIDGEPLPAVGTRSAVIDSDGRPVAVIELVEVRVARLGDVDLDHARDEGEGFETVAAWRAGHERFWHGEDYRGWLGDPAFTVDDDTAAVLERFRLVETL